MGFIGKEEGEQMGDPGPPGKEGPPGLLADEMYRRSFMDGWRAAQSVHSTGWRSDAESEELANAAWRRYQQGHSAGWAAVAGLAIDVPAPERATVLECQPGDVLVLQYRQAVSSATLERIATLYREVLGIRVMVLDQGARVDSVLRGIPMPADPTEV